MILCLFHLDLAVNTHSWVSVVRLLHQNEIADEVTLWEEGNIVYFPLRQLRRNHVDTYRRTLRSVLDK